MGDGDGEKQEMGRLAYSKVGRKPGPHVDLEGGGRAEEGFDIPSGSKDKKEAVS